MTQPNKLNMSDQERLRRKARLRQANNSNRGEILRELNPEINEIMDAVASGDLAPQEGADLVSDIQAEEAKQ